VVLSQQGKEGEDEVTDTAYLYQYFLENSLEKKCASPKDAEKRKPQAGGKEGKSDGKHAK
jgi:hypothetical protein